MMNHHGIRVKTGLRSGGTDAANPTLNGYSSHAAAFRTAGAYSGQFPWESTLERWAQETQAWMRSPRSRLKETIFPEQKVLRKERYWELDAMRGTAVVMMMAQHFIVGGLGLVSKSLAVISLGFWGLAKTWLMLGILGYLAGSAFSAPSFPRPSRKMAPGHRRSAIAGLELLTLAGTFAWLAFAGSGSAGFMIVMGISLSISYARKKQSRPDESFLPKTLKRSTGLFICAGLLSLFGYAVSPEFMAGTNILHVLAASLLVAYPFLSLPVGAALLAGLAIIAVGLSVTTSNPALSWFLFNPAQNMMVDYFSVLPWVGVVLLGVVLGKTLYPDGKRTFSVPDLGETKLAEFLAWVGEHALPIFMLQEPFFFLGRGKTLSSIVLGLA